ncbi:helix-turn-helix domain-containing protein [Psychrobacter glacincola]|uniref:helix-turn-helix domain-containing protein n=1 Tax=Psychrobacter glacincola TaxID=56810 RepID=UPI003D03CDB9
MATVTDFGKKLRKLRIDHEIMLKTMADSIGVSSPYLSAIETGRKPVNAQLLNNIINSLQLSEQEGGELTKLASKLEPDVVIKGNDVYETELALMFARRMDNKSFDLKKLEDFLNT